MYSILSSSVTRLLENKREQPEWTDETGTPYLTWCDKCNTAKPNPNDTYEAWICEECKMPNFNETTKQLKLF